MLYNRQNKCNEGITDSLKKAINYIKNKYDEFNKSTKPIGITSVDGIKSLGDNYNEDLKGSKGFNAARKLMMIMDGINAFTNSNKGNINIKFTTLSSSGVSSVDRAIEKFRDHLDEKKASKDAFVFKNDENGTKLIYINGAPNTKFGEKPENVLMTIAYPQSKSDNNSLSRKRLEWRIARLERLVYEKYNRLF